MLQKHYTDKTHTSEIFSTRSVTIELDINGGAIDTGFILYDPVNGGNDEFYIPLLVIAAENDNLVAFTVNTYLYFEGAYHKLNEINHLVTDDTAISIPPASKETYTQKLLIEIVNDDTKVARDFYVYTITRARPELF